jgi:hypothetical protein
MKKTNDEDLGYLLFHLGAHEAHEGIYNSARYTSSAAYSAGYRWGRCMRDDGREINERLARSAYRAAKVDSDCVYEASLLINSYGRDRAYGLSGGWQQRHDQARAAGLPGF